MAADIADAAMPEARDMFDQRLHRLAIVDADLIERGVGRAIDEHAGQAGVAQIGERAAFRIGARRQNDAVHPALVKRGDDRQFAVGVVLGVREEHHHAEAGAFGLDRADDVDEIGVGDRGNCDADDCVEAILRDRARTFG